MATPRDAVLDLFNSIPNCCLGQEQIVSFLPEFSSSQIVEATQLLLKEQILIPFEKSDTFELKSEADVREREIAKYASHHIV